MKFVLPVLLSGAALFIAACGGDDDDGEPTQASVTECLKEAGFTKPQELGEPLKALADESIEVPVKITAYAPEFPERAVQMYYYGDAEDAGSEAQYYEDLGRYPNTRRTEDGRGVIVGDFRPDLGFRYGPKSVYAGDAAMDAAESCLS